MIEPAAHILDWLNEGLVRLRVGGRQPVGDAEATRRVLEDLPAILFPGPDSLGSLSPVPRAGAGGADRLRRHSSREVWEAPSPWPEAEGRNRRWIATRILPGDGTEREDAPVLVLLHGWLAAAWHFPLYLSWARWMATHGIEVWIPRLPHHMERTLPGRVSGELCLSSDLARTVDSIRQGVVETRLLIEWLRRRGNGRCGLWGVSLGGWIASLAATVPVEIDALVLWAPVADPETTLWESSLARDIRAAIAASGLRRGADLGLERFAPRARRLRLDPNRMLIVGGRHDRVVAPWTLSQLAHAWRGAVWWVPHGHISMLVAPRVLRATRDFLGRRLRGRPAQGGSGLLS